MAKKAFISLTGGLNDVDRPDTLGEDQLQECVNYEIAGVGRLKKRTDPSVYNEDLNLLLAEVFPDGVNSISEPFYPPVKPENMTGDFIILVEGMSGADRLVEAFYEGANGWIYQDSNEASFFIGIRGSGVSYDSSDNIKFTVATGMVVISGGDNALYTLKISELTKSISVKKLGIDPPTNKPRLSLGRNGSDYDLLSGDLSIVGNPDSSISGMGLIQCQYTVLSDTGEESNPSPLSDTLFAQFFEVSEDGLGDNNFISSFKVHDLNLSDIEEGFEINLKYFKLYFRIIKYSGSLILSQMEFSQQVDIKSKVFSEFDTGNDYLIFTPPVPGNIISYENDTGVSAETVDSNAGVFMAGNIKRFNSLSSKFQYICPISIQNFNSGAFVDALVPIRIVSNDIVDINNNSVFPSWEKWFQYSTSNVYSSTQGGSGMEWLDDSDNPIYPSSHLRIYDIDSITPINVYVPGRYDSDDGYLDIVVKIPLLPNGQHTIYLCWNNIEEEVPSNLGIEDAYNDIGESPTYIRDDTVDADPRGWYNLIGFHYGRWNLSSDYIDTQQIFSYQRVRGGSVEFLANVHGVNLGLGGSNENLLQLKNLANLRYNGLPVSSKFARKPKSFGLLNHIADQLDDEVANIDELHLITDWADAFDKYIGVSHSPRNAGYTEIGELTGFSPFGSVDNVGFIARPGVTTADPHEFLKVNTYYNGSEPLAGVNASWDNHQILPLMKYKIRHPVVRENSTIKNGWAGSSDDIKDHFSYGAFMPGCSGWQMQDLAEHIGKIPDKSFARVSITFTINDILAMRNDNIAGGTYADNALTVAGAAGQYTTPIIPSLNSGTSKWTDNVIFYISAGDCGTDPEDGENFGVSSSYENSPMLSRGVLKLEIRRCGEGGDAPDFESGIKPRLLLTYEHFTANAEMPGMAYGDTFSIYPNVQENHSIIIDSDFSKHTYNNSTYETYDGNKTHYSLDIVLSLDHSDNKGYLYYTDKEDASMEVKGKSFTLNEARNDTSGAPGTWGDVVSLESSWRGKNFYDMGLGISYGLHMLRKVMKDGVPKNYNVIGQSSDDTYMYGSDTDEEDYLTADINEVLPFGTPLIRNYSAAHCFIGGFEFTTEVLINTKNKAFSLFNEVPLNEMDATIIGVNHDKMINGDDDWFNTNIEFKTIQTSTELNRLSTIIWSEINRQAFPDLNYKILKEPVKKIIAAPSFLQFEYSNTFLIFTRNTINRFVLKGEASGWSGSSDSLIEENTQFGLYADNTLVKVGKEIFWLSEEGVIRWNTEGMINISKNVINVGNSGGLYNGDLYSAMYCPVRNQYILQYTNGNQSFVYDLTYRMWTTFTGLAFNSSAILSGGSQAENVNLILNENEIFSYPGSAFTDEAAHIRTKDMFLDAGKVDRVRLQYTGNTNATLTYQLNGESRNGDAYAVREHTISSLKANVWRGAGNLGFGRMANIKVENVEELHSIMFDVKLKGGE